MSKQKLKQLLKACGLKPIHHKIIKYEMVGGPKMKIDKVEIKKGVMHITGRIKLATDQIEKMWHPKET